MLEYEEYHRRWFVDVTHGTAKDRRKVAVGKIRAMLWRAHWVEQKAKDEEVWAAHEHLYQNVIVPLGEQMEANPDFHPELQKLGVRKQRIDPMTLERRLSWLLELSKGEALAPDPGERERILGVTEDVRLKHLKSFTKAMDRWVGLCCPTLKGDARFRVYVGYETLLAYFMARGAFLMDVHRQFESWATWFRDTRKEELPNLLEKPDRSTSHDFHSVKRVLAMRRDDPRLWTALFSKSLFVWNECQELETADQADLENRDGNELETGAVDYQVLVQQIRDALEATAGSEPDDVVLRVRAGLDAFDAFRKTSPKDVWSGGKGRYVLDSTPRFWLWGRAFCEDVLPLTKDPRVTHKEAVAAVLLQPLPSPQARSKAARGWTLSFGELKRLILMLGQNRRVPIAPVVWSLMQRGVPVNIDRSWQSLWNQLSHAWGRNGFPLNYQMRP